MRSDPAKAIRTICFLLLWASGSIAFPQSVDQRYEDSLRALPDDSAKVTNLLKLNVRYRNADPARAKGLAQAALAAARNSPYKGGEVIALNAIGYQEFISGNMPAARDSFGLALDLARQLDRPALVARCLNNLGNLANANGNKDEALARYLESLDLREQVGDRRGASVNLVNIGIIYDELGRYAEAMEFYERALVIKTELGDKRGMGIALENMAVVLSLTDRKPAAEQKLARAIGLYRDVNDSIGLASCLVNLGAIRRDRGQYPDALAVTHEALRISDRLADPHGQQVATHNLAEIHLTLEQFAEARRFIDRSEAAAYASGSQESEHKVLALKSRILAATGNHRAALEAYRAHIEIRDSLANEKTAARLAELQTQYETAQKEKEVLAQQSEIELLKRDKAFSQLLMIGGGTLLALVLLLVWIAYQRQRAEVERKAAENRLMEADLQHKNKELVTFTLQTAQRNELLERLTEEVERIRTDTQGQAAQELHSLAHSIRGIRNEERNWDEFKLRFEQVEGAFFRALQQQFPELSVTETRLCALIRLQLSSKEIAGMLNIGHESVNKARYRLRKKLGLQKGEDLDAFIQGL